MPTAATRSAQTLHKSICRFCHANCGIEVTVEDRKPVAIRGDREDPVFGGYTCLKGRELASAHTHPDRLITPMKRQADGSFAPIASSDALDEIAEKLDAIRKAHGPRAIATYNGTYAFQNSSGLAAAMAFHAGIGSPMFHTSVTIDQPAKVYLWSRVGAWGGGFHSFCDADVSLVFGNNPVVSHYAPPGGVPPFSPSRRIQDARARGLKLIVVDPRETEYAANADLFLQPLPGTDAQILAGLINVILEEGLHDKAFAQAHIEGIPELREAIRAYTPERVAAEAGISAASLVEAARLFAGAKRGVATTGTGPEMSGQGSMVTHLILALNYICGRVYREGEVSPVPKITFPLPAPRKAEVTGPAPLYGEGFEKSRVRGLTMMGQEMPVAALADEILTPGEGQVKALICIGGNPAVAWPNREKVLRALQEVDLLVTVDNRINATSRYADYVLAPKMCLERDDITNLSEWWYEEPYGRYVDAVVDAPGDTLNEWEILWELSRRLGTDMVTAGGPMPMDRRPSDFEALSMMHAGSLVSIAELREKTVGKVGTFWPEADYVVQPGDPDRQDRLQLAPADVIAELRALAGGGPLPAGFTHRLTSRRTKHMFNSAGHDLPNLAKKGSTNFAHMNPQDMASLGLSDGQLVAIASAHGEIGGIVKAADDVRPGVISMAHAFNGLNDDVRGRGAPTNTLVDDETDFDPITGMVRQSAIPVRVSAVAAQQAAE